MKSRVLSGPLFLIFFSIVVFIAAMNVAALALPVVLIAPAFFMVLERKYGVRAAMAGVCLGSVLVLIAAGPPPAFVYMVAMGLLGVAFGQMAGRFKTGGEFLIAAITASVIVKIFLMTLLYVSTGVNVFYVSPESAERVAASVAEILSSSGVSLTGEELRRYAKNLVDTMSLQMPAVFIVFSAFDTFASYLVSWRVLKKTGGGKIVSLPPFGLWKFPRNIFIAFFVAVIADAIGRMSPNNHAFTMIAANILELLRGLFFLEGLALCWYYMTAQGVSRFFKIAATTLCVALWPVSFILSSLGFVDVWFDLRRHIRRKQK